MQSHGHTPRECKCCCGPSCLWPRRGPLLRSLHSLLRHPKRAAEERHFPRGKKLPRTRPVVGMLHFFDIGAWLALRVVQSHGCARHVSAIFLDGRKREETMSRSRAEAGNLVALFGTATTNKLASSSIEKTTIQRRQTLERRCCDSKR